MKIQKRPAHLPPGEWAGDHAISIPCVCGKRYDSPRGQFHTCPRCGHRWDTMEPGPMPLGTEERLLRRQREARRNAFFSLVWGLLLTQPRAA